jgi:hypothetical protein
VKEPALDGVGVCLASPDTDGLFQIHHEDLAVTDLAGVGCLGNGLNDSIQHVITDRHVNFYLGQKIDNVLGTAIQLGVTFLPAKTLDLGHSDALYTNLGQRLAHIIQFEGLDYSRY